MDGPEESEDEVEGDSVAGGGATITVGGTSEHCVAYSVKTGALKVIGTTVVTGTGIVVKMLVGNRLCACITTVHCSSGPQVVIVLNMVGKYSTVITADSTENVVGTCVTNVPYSTLVGTTAQTTSEVSPPYMISL